MSEERWMMFVDGENLTLRIQEAAHRASKPLKGRHLQDVYFWSGWLDQVAARSWPPRIHKDRLTATRAYYYTCMTGDEGAINDARDELLNANFRPVIIKKAKGRRAKGVDISLTKDMLVHAFHDNYDTAMLVAGDGDYVPVVEEVMRMGKRVIVMFLGKESGLNEELRRAADWFVPISMDAAGS